MFLEKVTVTEKINELATAACCELFADYGVNLARGHFDWGTSNDPLLSSVMGFVCAQVRGTCLLACERGPLEASCPPGGRIRDWIGELTNQLVGRIKVKLLAYEIDVALTTPIVLQGIRIQPLPKTASEPAVFSSGNGFVLAWTEVEVADAFSLPAPRVPEAGETGELMLF